MYTARFTRPRRLAALALTAALSGASLAAHAGHHGDHHGGHYAGHHGGYGMFGERMAKELDLNAEQRALLDAGRQQRQQAMQEGKALRESLRGLVQSDKYDEAAVAKVADQLAGHMRTQLIEQSRRSNELYRSLTPDQRARLAELEQQRAERWQKYRQKYSKQQDD